MKAFRRLLCTLCLVAALAISISAGNMEMGAVPDPTPVPPAESSTQTAQNSSESADSLLTSILAEITEGLVSLLP